MQSSSTSTQIPLCNEYCDGNTAEFYCPECSAMFCGSCYDREHCGNERKSQHGKLTELRAICCAHKHTLDYFNLTTLQPMCVICRKETLQSPEFAHHVIDNIEVTVPKLRSLMEKKLNIASELIDRLSSEIAKVENAAKNTTIAAVNYIKCAFLKLRKYLDESEAELVQSARRYFDEFLEVNDERVEVKNAIRNLRALAEEGQLLLTKEARSLAVEFPSVFRRLEELCNSKNEEQQTKDLEIIIKFEDRTCEQLKQLIKMTSYSTIQIGESIMLNELTDSSTAANNNGCGSSPDCLPGRKRFFPNPSTSSCDEPCSKQPRINYTACQITPECDSSSPLTPSKAMARQTVQIASPLPSKLSKRPCRVGRPPKSPSCSSPKATTASPIAGDSCKRRRRGGELSKEFQKCDAILTELWAQDDSYPFARPVDKKQSPDYYKVISNPIDLSVIKEKLHSLQYASAVDFVKDFRLMISNCRAYNPPDTFVYNAGEELNNIFNRLLKINFPNFEDVFLDDSVEEDD